ncbi:MAG: DNA polymerase III subunit gamma/tau [Proteobacteria bacterium]|nr:DNA polymerase III subunit gamma/tau [Pseudomonadota bacterium]
MSYIVLARKWRPQTFADLVGQQHIAVTLRNAIAQNRVAHAFLFTGSRGVGKTSTARIFAKALNCEHFPADEPCNECQSCREITEGHSMDVIEIDGASNRGINEIREVLDAVRYAPSRDRYKIYIIDEVHMLTTEAFNALLKTLEEPPPHVVFIFATTDPNKIPITIVSRCQRYDFKRISTDDLVAHLAGIAKAENIAFEESALHLIARTARGGVRDALSAMDQIIAFAEQPINGERAAEVLGVASRETLMKMGECIVKRDIEGALACIAKVDHYGQNLSQFAFDLLEFLRDVAVLSSAPNAPVELNAAEKATVSPWLTLTSPDRLQRIFQIWYQTSEQLPKSLSPRLVMEMAAIRMCQVETVVPIDGILRRIDAIAKALSNSSNIAPDAMDHIQGYMAQLGLSPDAEKKKPDLTPKSDDLPKVPLSLPQPSAPQTLASTVPVDQPTLKPPSSTIPLEDTISKPSTGTGFVGNSAPQQTPSSVPVDHSISKPPANTVPAGNPRSKSQATPIPSPEDDNFFNDAPWPDETEDIVSPDDFSGMDSAWDNLEEDSLDPDADPEDAINDVIDKKTLEVSANRPKTAPLSGVADTAHPSEQQLWKQLIRKIEGPLSKILARARIDCYSKNSVEITLPLAFHGLITADHIALVDRLLAKEVHSGCRFVVHYDEIGDDTETVAAQEAREQLQSEQKAFARVREHPLMQAIVETFHIDPSSVRFTIHPDRINS